MAKISGINVCGYHIEDKGEGNRGMQTCGQFEIGNFAGSDGTKNPEEWITKLTAMSYNKGPSCNIVFSITGSNFLKEYGPYKGGLLDYLLNHSNTRVMHWYKNDAHGPNWIFLCIYHRQLPSMKTSPGYTVDEIRKRITYKLGVYNMKEGPECS